MKFLKMVRGIGLEKSRKFGHFCTLKASKKNSWNALTCWKHLEARLSHRLPVELNVKVMRHGEVRQGSQTLPYGLFSMWPIWATKVASKKAFYVLTILTSRLATGCSRRRRKVLKVSINFSNYSRVSYKSFEGHPRLRKKYFESYATFMKILKMVRGIRLEKSRKFCHFYTLKASKIFSWNVSTCWKHLEVRLSHRLFVELNEKAMRHVEVILEAQTHLQRIFTGWKSSFDPGFDREWGSSQTSKVSIEARNGPKRSGKSSGEPRDIAVSDARRIKFIPYIHQNISWPYEKWWISSPLTHRIKITTFIYIWVLTEQYDAKDELWRTFFDPTR